MLANLLMAGALALTGHHAPLSASVHQAGDDRYVITVSGLPVAMEDPTLVLMGHDRSVTWDVHNGDFAKGSSVRFTFTLKDQPYRVFAVDGTGTDPISGPDTEYEFPVLNGQTEFTAH